MEKYLNQFWSDYSFIHNTTKELYILSEEYDDEFSSFIQPIKEQKDSLEHIVRAYTRLSKSTQPISGTDEEYIKQNLDKALGHNFRSFFDCADILSIILREKLSVQLQNYSYSKIISVWPEYESARKILVSIPKKFAELRNAKDVAKSSAKRAEMVEEYRSCIDELFKIYHKFMYEIYPILNK